jgi:hypothetical protein
MDTARAFVSNNEIFNSFITLTIVVIGIEIFFFVTDAMAN